MRDVLPPSISEAWLREAFAKAIPERIGATSYYALTATYPGGGIENWAIYEAQGWEDDGAPKFPINGEDCSGGYAAHPMIDAYVFEGSLKGSGCADFGTTRRMYQFHFCGLDMAEEFAQIFVWLYHVLGPRIEGW